MTDTTQPTTPDVEGPGDVPPFDTSKLLATKMHRRERRVQVISPLFVERCQTLSASSNFEPSLSAEALRDALVKLAKPKAEAAALARRYGIAATAQSGLESESGPSPETPGAVRPKA